MLISLLHILALVLNLMIYPYADGNSLNSPLLNQVVKCPMNETSWRQKSREMCNNTQDTFYHCLPTNSLNAYVEYCLRVQTILQDYCAIYNIYSETPSFGNDSYCKGKKNFSCPTGPYSSKDIHKYPSCLKINPIKKCYLDDPTCPNVVSNSDGFTNTWQLPLLVFLWNAVGS